MQLTEPSRVGESHLGQVKTNLKLHFGQTVSLLDTFVLHFGQIKTNYPNELCHYSLKNYNTNNLF